MSLPIRAVLIDFDGTTVTHDMLDVLCDLNGKQAESSRLNQLFHRGEINGITGLIQRINLLQGISVKQIHEKIAQNMYLMPGAEAFFTYLKAGAITSILHSGNIIPVLDIYKDVLGIDYVVGANPIIRDGIIEGISDDAFPVESFKLHGIQRRLAELSIVPEECLAIGDSPADAPIFEHVKYSIAINPKSGIERQANFVIQNDLSAAISILESIKQNA